MGPPGVGLLRRRGDDDGRRPGWSRARSSASGFGGGAPEVEAGFLPAAVALPVEDEFVGGGLEPVDGALGQEGVGHLADPLDRLPVRRDDRGRGPVPLDDEFVDVGGVERVEGLEHEVIEDQQVDPDELAELGVVTVIQPGRPQPLARKAADVVSRRVTSSDSTSSRNSAWPIWRARARASRSGRVSRQRPSLTARSTVLSSLLTVGTGAVMPTPPCAWWRSPTPGERTGRAASSAGGTTPAGRSQPLVRASGRSTRR